jgi:ABC-type bacteriocin/lantibiotic exporter with double-glycine peptidase domain
MTPIETDTMPKIPVPYRSQREPEILENYGTRGCGVSSLAMVLDYYGHKLSGHELKKLADETDAYQGVKGWTHDGLIKIGRKLGLSGYRINYDFKTDEDLEKSKQVLAAEGEDEKDLERFSNSFDFARKHTAYEDIERLISQNIPVIASMSAEYTGLSYSHMVVITAIDSEKVSINDPWDNGGDYELPRDEFEKYWTHRVVVLYPETK